ncbi:MAG TPA: type 1 glutamine amidotransferase domain-containing protein, partial [Polyangiales bacterium]|nr:type 1 glutamine amidotransferase domain-containing protein [Polyangiales bacterium]
MDKILAIATNDATELKGKRTGLWLSELTHFLAVIEDAGFGYDLASPQGGRIPLDERSAVAAQLKDAVNARYMANPAFKQRLEQSLSCSDVEPAQYVALYLSGGHGTMFDFRQSSALQRLITTMYSADKYLSGVCHGVAGFVDAKDAGGRVIVTGKNVTGFSNFEDGLAGTKRLLPFLLEDALKQNGARYKKNLLPFTERVELDGKLITGQNPQSAAAVGRRL